MFIEIVKNVMEQIQKHGETAYPEEGAGLLLGRMIEGGRQVVRILPVSNKREDGSRYNRYFITAQDMLLGELTAAQEELEVIGIFHSHPDHPNQPSEFDRDHALPWYTYLITSINEGTNAGSRVWQLLDDRSAFTEQEIRVIGA